MDRLEASEVLINRGHGPRGIFINFLRAPSPLRPAGRGPDSSAESAPPSPPGPSLSQNPEDNCAEVLTVCTRVGASSGRDYDYLEETFHVSRDTCTARGASVAVRELREEKKKGEEGDLVVRGTSR